MRKTAALVIFFMSIVIVYAQAEDNTSAVVTNATNNGTTYKINFITGFEKDYSKPKPQNTADATNQSANQTAAQMNEEIAAPAKVFMSK